MSPPRVLVVCHGHPDLVPGGTELVARDLCDALRSGGEAETMFLGCVTRLHRQPRPSGRLQGMPRRAAEPSTPQAAGRADEMLMWVGGYDPFMMAQTEAADFAKTLKEVLAEFAPDVVHFHHLSLIGLEALALVRRFRPRARIVVTLHDYMAICANDGLMVERDSGVRCRAAAPDACHRCFPDVPQSRFRVRQLHVQSMFGLVDRFVAPSRFLRDRFVQWGLAPERIAVIANAVPGRRGTARHDSGDGLHRRFAYFGNIAPHKGVLVALAAARRLTAQPVAFDIHGGLNFQDGTFRADFETALAAAAETANWRGPYRREDVPDLMAGTGWVVVPSTWWENAPLVILEAFRQGRPVICSDIGGMAEMVQDDVNGLHFRAGDAADLARVMRRAAGDSRLWQRLAAGVPRVPQPGDAARMHLELYRKLHGESHPEPRTAGRSAAA